MFKTKNHTFLRFFLDITMLLILFFLLILPVYLTFTLKVVNLNFRSIGIERVAGTSVSR